jgi:predicted metalloprotease with PDZ domain
MRDVPFSRYTFILHFPREGGGGGMEHRNGTAISVPASQLRDHWESLEGVAAHEFFHLWNVKRIRPQALEPIDYVRGNDTRDLWFSEGVTSAYGELCLLRAGLITPQVFYARLAESVRALQERPARAFQSVETSGREAWLEKYPDYSRPERSISYYNKGALLGFLLDLAIRHASHNQAGLDDVMRRLNEDFARPGRFFTLADLGAIVRSLAPSYAGLDAFLRDDVQGTHELDYDTYLAYAGLRLLRKTEEIPAWDFVAMRSFEGHIEVESVDPGSNAQKAGLQRGDVLLKMNGKPLFVLRDLLHSSYRPGQRVKFDVHRRQGDAVVEYALEGKEGTTYRVEELPHPTAEQRQVRVGWLRGTTGIVGAHGVRPVGGRAPLAPTSTIREGRP